MTSNISGIPTAPASTDTTAQQRPDAVSNRADVTIDLAIELGVSLATERARHVRIALAASLGEDGDLVACDPLRDADDHSATGELPCPIYNWCTGHEAGEDITEDTLHTGEPHRAATFGLQLHREAGVTSIAASPDVADKNLLHPDEADALAAALSLYAAAARSVAA